MTNSIGDVALTVGADITPLTRGLNQAGSEVRTFSNTTTRDIRKSIDGFVKLGAAATAAAAGGLVAIHKSAAKAGSEIIRLANVSNTSATEFQKWAIAADTVGVEQDKLADILKDVNDKVGDFMETGAGPMADFFENIAPKVGVTADEFANLSGPDALGLYVKSLEEANVSQDRMTFYLEAIASDTTNLLPILKNGGALIKEMGDEAEKTGLILSDFDLAQLEKSEQLFKELKRDSAAFFNIIGAKLAPFFNVMIDGFNQSTKGSESLGDTLTDVIESGVRGFGFVADVVNGLHVVLKGMQVTLGLVAQGYKEIWSAAGGDVDIEQARKNQEELQKELQNLMDTPVPSTRYEEFLEKVKAMSKEAVEEIASVNNSVFSDEGMEKVLTTQSQISKTALESQKAVGGKLTELVGESYGDQAQIVANSGKLIINSMAGTNKKAFKLQKAWAMTDALLSTYQGIAKGVAMGLPQGIPTMLWAATQGFAQVNKIKSQQFGGSSSGGGSAGASSTSSVPTGGFSTQSSAPAPQQSQTLTVEGISPDALFSGSMVQSLAERLTEFSSDGGTVVFAK